MLWSIFCTLKVALHKNKKSLFGLHADVVNLCSQQPSKQLLLCSRVTCEPSHSLVLLGRKPPAGWTPSRVHSSLAWPATTESCCWTSVFRSAWAPRARTDTCSSSRMPSCSQNSSKECRWRPPYLLVVVRTAKKLRSDGCCPTLTHGSENDQKSSLCPVYLLLVKWDRAQTAGGKEGWLSTLLYSSRRRWLSFDSWILLFVSRSNTVN